MQLSAPADKVSFPLTRYPLIATRDLGDAGVAVSREIEPHRFTCPHGWDEADAQINCVRLPRTRLFGVQLGSNVLATTPPMHSLQLVVPLSGELIRRGAHTDMRFRPGEGMLHRPGPPVNVIWSSYCVALVAWVERHALDDLMERLFGAPMSWDVEGPPKVDLTRGVGLSIADSLRTIIVELEDGESLFSRGITARSVEETLLTSIVHAAFEGQGTLRETHGGPTFGPQLRRTLEYIHAHLQDEVTIAELTQVAGVSLRTLQYEFAKHFGVGPMTLVRREKLRCARRELLEIPVREATIGDIAARWGFLDTKHFTRLYRREFGERPSDARRARPSASPE